VVDGTSIADPKTNLPKLRSRVGMVFQHFELFPHLTITENLTIAQRKVLGRSEAEATKKGLALLDRVGLVPMPRSTLASCPVASSSAWRSPAPWRWTRSSCCSTNRPRHWTRKWSTKCWT
jgi:ABC-type phosphate transport system ATPase subunit